MNMVLVFAVLAVLLSVVAGYPEADARRGGASIKVRPIRRNSRKSTKKAKSKPRAMLQTHYSYYQPHYPSYYQPRYDPTGHGDPHFSYFQGR